MSRPRTWQVNLTLVLLVLALAWLNLCIGVRWYALSDLWRAGALVRHIMWTIRVPRVIAAACVGALLAFAGQLMQGLSRNPIADPSILGINAGATLALMLGGLAGLSLTPNNALWLSMLGAGVAFCGVLALAIGKRGIDVLRFILGGSVFSSLLTGIAYAVGLLTNTTQQFRNLLIGGFANATSTQAKVVAIGLVLVILVAMVCHRSLSLMVLDDATAKSLGAKPNQVRLLASALVVICAGLAVAVAGNIGFVGLGVPQMIAWLHPDRLEHNIAPTMLGGAGFMLAVDSLAKGLEAPNELPLAAISAICGGAFLLMILNTRRARL